MSSAGVAAQEIRVPLKSGFLHNGQALGSVKACWGSRREFEKCVGDFTPPESLEGVIFKWDREYDHCL
uniref:ERBB receptor feedback inhibitor 1 n=1 Tax=Rousettus aegyptiacus TaxID=9407 RepID=A0A7J8K7Z9_ROUAE|nr:ERBB receptor feedback inhibitor 1 [Rousettus aegyptiacus]